MPPEVRLAHVNVEVSDLARARRFYDVFLPAIGFDRLPIRDRAWVGYRSGRQTIWLTVSHPPRSSHRRPHVPTTGQSDPISEHLGFRVASAGILAALERRLRRRGLKPVYPLSRVRTRSAREYVSDARSDPDNNVLELFTTA